MRAITWNIRGIGSDSKISGLRALVREHRVEMLLIQETKMGDLSVDFIRKFWYDDFFDFVYSPSEGRSGGILTIWDKSVFNLEDSTVNNNFLRLSGYWRNVEGKVAIVNVYSPCNLSDQRALWHTLLELKSQVSEFWLVGGDFNAVLNKGERSGGSRMLSNCKDFNAFIEVGNLIDLPMLGKKFTWFGPKNRRSRLDRFLLEADWMTILGDLAQTGLKRVVSDHAPVLLASDGQDWGPKPFKFFNAWLKMEGCKERIKEVFNADTNSDLSFKLRSLKTALKDWNNTGKKDLHSKAKDLERKLEELEENGNDGELDAARLEEVKKLQMELWDVLRLQEAIWKQKSRMNWLTLGDSNTAFFHKATKIRAKRGVIHGLNIAGVWCGNPVKLKQGIFEHFAKQFQCMDRSWKASFNMDFKKLNDMEANKLEEPFSLGEIKEAIWECDDSKAPGPDCFNLRLFKCCWTEVKEDLRKVFDKFHRCGMLAPSVNSTFIVLIPKKGNPTEISDFRPISLVLQKHSVPRTCSNRKTFCQGFRAKREPITLRRVLQKHSVPRTCSNRKTFCQGFRAKREPITLRRVLQKHSVPRTYSNRKT
ncbi:hypothetical protein HRI_005259800 [Hibiscus trionum]|uniref:Endonuclease/exonuclease/phosphatase domain-containing protein n=1 Tax=Hibiscus trionum TaxID=183268 RepID=A0A9W7JHW9_HIBTR|nr:hypothetical protein HRI_005259800 [Hibiscus trionum]